jgi:putative glutamine amidotransferase
MVLIGVTPSLTEKGNMTVNQDYMDAVFRAGALPVLLPLTEDEAVMREMLGRVDGLLLTGGDDVGPEMYGEEKLPCCGKPPPAGSV